MNRLGISYEDLSMLVFAVPMTGRKYMFTSSGRVTLEKQWSDIPQPYPIQTLIKVIAFACQHMLGLCNININ